MGGDLRPHFIRSDAGGLRGAALRGALGPDPAPEQGGTSVCPEGASRSRLYWLDGSMR